MSELSKEQLEYIVNHVFLPPELPNGAQPEELAAENDLALCQLVLDTALEFSGEGGESGYTPFSDNPHQWRVVTGLLRKLVDSQLSPSTVEIQQSLRTLRTGDSFVVYVRAQNAAIIIRSLGATMRFEIFELSAPNDHVMNGGKLACAFPGPAIDIPCSMAKDSDFISELAIFLIKMSSQPMPDAQPTAHKAKTQVQEPRNTTNPRYITQLLTGILHGIGHPADIQRVQKRIADEVHWRNAFLPWRRSPFWLVLRVAVQTTLLGSGHNHQEYKSFMAYLLAKILQLVVDAKFPSDLIHIMHAKLNGRMAKLHRSFGPMNGQLLNFLNAAGHAAHHLRAQRWENIRKCQAEPIHWAPETLDLERDIVLSLTKSQSHINHILTSKSDETTPPPFLPNEPPRYLPPNHTHVDFGHGADDLEEAIDADEALALADFEESVQTYLDDWVCQRDRADDRASCESLAEHFRLYSAAASKLYESNVENWSIMLLTLLELWMAIDQLAVDQLPLIKDYRPEVSPALLEPLLLRTFQSTQRAICIMNYCHMRAKHATLDSVFSDVVSERSFGVRYFRASPRLQRLESQITRAAESERLAAIHVFLETKEQYEELTLKAERAEHDYLWKRVHHHSLCRKCSWSSEANHLRVPIHEWPLPNDKLEVLNVIFELQAPSVFCIWRDVTYGILRDLCTPTGSQPSKAKIHEQLDTYQRLSSYNTWKGERRRIRLASSAKTFEASHYKNVSPTAEQDTVCCPCGLQFHLYDSLQHRWARSSFSFDVSQHSTFRIPTDSPYHSLQFSVNSTMHTPNFVLASQSECAQELEINEFIAFGALRAGGRLQWLNIAREIAAKSLSMERWEVQVLIMQSIWQIGPVRMGFCGTAPFMDWHEELGNTRFCQRMLSILDSLHGSIKANWTQMKAAHTAALIACRLLAFAERPKTCNEILSLIRRIRKTMYDWMQNLSNKLRNADEQVIGDLQVRLCEAAASCRATYDVEDVYIEDAFRTEEAVAIFIECAITLYDNMPSIKSLNARKDIEHLLDHDRRLSHSLETYIATRLSRDPSVLRTSPSLRTIQAHRPVDMQFEQMTVPNDRWFASVPTAPNEPRVHLNVLTGQLLVDGRPTRRLPREISEHPMFLRIFGSAVLDVIPTRNQRMPYATRDCIHGYRVALGLAENGQAIAVEAEDPSGHLFNLIPHTVFRGDLPFLLVDSYAHWMERPAGHIELRPIESPWDTAETRWRMRRRLDGTYQMHNSSCSLLDIRSPTVYMISSRLASIEASEHLIVTRSSDRRLSVDLPRYRLQFSLRGNDLLSENHPGFIVDSVQTIGTFFGLHSQLVLAPSSGKLYARKRLIVPRGNIHIHPSQDHVEITIDAKGTKNVHYHEYEVDETLGQLVDNGDLLSRFTKIYLHAITSFCLPDPLSGLTGTEMAIEELRSSSCLSFQKLQDPEFRMLGEIRAVAPRREWYPAHCQLMQTMEWHPSISFLSQHDDFIHYSSIIMQHAERMLPHDQRRQRFDITPDVRLQDRAVFRRGWCYPASLQRFPLLEDVRYSHEERKDGSDCGHANEPEVASLSTVILHPGNFITPVGNLWEIFEEWSTLHDAREVKIEYSHKWWKPKWREIWLPLCRALRDIRTPSLLFTLSTAAYTSPRDRQLVHTLLAFATEASLWQHPPMSAGVPNVLVYDLRKGTKPDRAALESILRGAAYFEDSPFYDATFEVGRWGNRNMEQRRSAFAVFEATLESQAKEAVGQLIDQWPCENPRSPSLLDGSSWLFNLPELMPHIRGRFSSWYHNYTLHQHIAAVQRTLNTVRLRSARLSPLPYPAPLSSEEAPRREGPSLCAVSLISLIGQRDPPKLPPSPSQISGEFMTMPIAPHTHTDCDLKPLFALFQDSCKPMLQKYGEHLEASHQAMTRQRSSTFLKSPTESECKGHVVACENQFKAALSVIVKVLEPANYQVQTFLAGLWPHLTVRTILGLLSHQTINRLSKPWRDTIMQLAYSLLIFQRARRIHLLHVANDKLSLEKELQNIVPENERNPDWQLIQVEGDFLLRLTQRSVAKAMIAPRSGRSTLQQLQMGEGKSSVIVPLVAAHLSNGKALVRIVVLKPLVSQMFRIMVRRLSGLAQRRIYYMPISRSTKIDVDYLRDLQRLWEECVRDHGVLIAQPEHILSFKLMAADHNIRLANTARSHSPSIARSLLESAKWLWSNSRDILDESDEILRVRYQVIYTMGLQAPTYDHPNRWLTTQCVLTRVRRRIPEISRMFPDDITAEDSNKGRFPRLRSIGADATRALIDAIVEDALNGELSTCPQLSHLSPPLRMVAKTYMTKLDDLGPDDVPSLCSHYGKDSSVWKTILLLRGLLAHGVLSYALGARRYRVDYGLAPERSMLAVPYRAKDVPSLRAEFGHPDVCIILTCLSYHYGGLTVEQVNQCFEILLGLDHRKQEYSEWVMGNPDLPEYLRDLDGVNLKDPEQRELIFSQLFQHNHAIIDFLLSHVVFPGGAKEFPQKMTTSGWDLVESKKHVTTGFSGNLKRDP